MKRIFLSVLFISIILLLKGYSLNLDYYSKEYEYKKLTENFNFWINSPIILNDEIIFFYKGNAKKILIAGEFNNWKPELLMDYKNTNLWEFSWTKRLSKGRYKYKLIIDDIWTRDPYNTNLIKDNSGQEMSYFDLIEDFIPNAKYPLLLKDDIYVFNYKDNKAKNVSLVGSFNNWNPYSHSMTNLGSDEFEIKIRLKKGLHIYCFVVDGEWVPDYNNLKQYRDNVGNVVSILYIK